MNTTVAEKIFELKTLGLSYRKIQTILNCSKGTISYHLGEGQKNKTINRTLKRRGRMTRLERKIEYFKHCKPKEPYIYPINKEIRSTKQHLKRKLIRKIIHFETLKHPITMKKLEPSITELTFTPENIIEKSQSKCYLTGRLIDFNDTRSYELDHIIPRSLEGPNTFENCGVACRDANQAKSHMTLEEFFQICIDVVKYNNLKID